MDFESVIRRRRMVRRYRTESIDENALERIIWAALRGPTAGFSQGIDLVVVTKRELREKVDTAIGGDGTSHLVDAPVQIVITADEDRYHRRYQQPDKVAISGGRETGWPVPYWFVDAGAAMMLVLLAAINEGLAAGFFGHPDHVARLQDVLGLPPNVVPIGVITVGYGAEGPVSNEQRERRNARRRPASDVVHREQW